MIKKILITLSIFIALFLLTDRVFVYLFEKNIFSKTLSGESGGSINYLINKKHDSDFIILGTSRAKHQLDPALFVKRYKGNGYNVGVNGVGEIVYNSILLDILTKNNIHPKQVILQTDVYQFAENENIAHEVVPLYPFIKQSTLFNKYIDFKEKIKLYIHSYRYNGKLLNLVFNYFKRNTVVDNNGYIPLYNKLDPTRVTVKSVQKRTKLSQAKLAAVQDIINTCNSNNIQLTVILPPFYNNIGYNKEDVTNLINTLHKMGIKEVINLADCNSIPALKSAELWKDVTHLNNDGAQLLSEAINDRL